MNAVRLVVFGMLALSTLTANTSVRSHRAWPWFMLVRGGGLEKAVIISRPVTVTMAPALDRPTPMSGDIVALYASLNSSTAVPADYRTRRYYEVAEFWGPGWMPLPNGGAPQVMRFELGDTFAKIYVGTRTKPPVWVGRSQGAGNAARIIGDSGQAILTRAGLKLR
jgi:hypothetical protein